MNVVKWVISGLVGALAFSWSLRLHEYFYGLVMADKLSLLLSMVVSFFLFKRIAFKLEKWSILVFTALVALLFLLYPLIKLMILSTPYSWLLIHLFVSLTVLSIRSLINTKLLFITPLVFGSVFFFPFSFKKEQLRFYDRLESSIHTRYGEAQIVQWKGDFWMYYNQQLQFSTIDGHVFREAYVQPVMQFSKPGDNVLLIGGDNGLVESELSKFTISLTILPWDLEFHSFSRNSDYIPFTPSQYREIKKDEGAFDFLTNHPDNYDVIIIDMPDPLSLDYKEYYTAEFYELIFSSLKKDGIMVTQSGDYYKNNILAQRIWNSVSSVGFQTVPFQCQIPTIGHWSWVLGVKGRVISEIKETLSAVKSKETIWWNQESADMMFSFGKNYFSNKTTTINRLNKPTQ